MSLKAGYKGIKNSLAVGMSAFMQKFANALVIKSIGSGLSLSEAGELSASAQSVDYSTTEFNTGKKWIDGSDIYGIVIVEDNPTTSGGSNQVKYTGINIASLNIKDLVDYTCLVGVYTGSAHVEYFCPREECASIDWSCGTGDLVYYTEEKTGYTNFEVKIGKLFASFDFVRLTLFYTKNTASQNTVSQNTRKKGGNK